MIAEQLKASTDALRVAEILSARGVPRDRALRFGEIVLRMTDSDEYEAALWYAAEQISSLTAGGRTVAPLRLAMAVQQAVEAVLGGTLSPDRVAQCAEAYHVHRRLLVGTVTRFPRREVQK